MNALFAAVLAFAAPASAQQRPFYPDAASFQAAVVKTFQAVEERSGVTGVELRFVDTAQDPGCDFGAGATEKDFNIVEDKAFIKVCSKLRDWIEDPAELYFVLAHEFGHLKYRHQTAALNKENELLTAYRASHQAPPNLSLYQELDWALDGIRKDMQAFLVEKEKEADAFAVQLMRQAGLDPRQGARLLDRAQWEQPSPEMRRFLGERSRDIRKLTPRQPIPDLPKDGDDPFRQQ